MQRGQKKQKSGAIIPNGVLLEKHELDIVLVFTDLGYDVELIPYARAQGMKTADAIIDGVKWEFKTVYKNKTHSIEHILRRATSQSKNIVVDLRHLSSVMQNNALKKTRYAATQVRDIKRLKAIIRPNRIIDIK